MQLLKNFIGTNFDNKSKACCALSSVKCFLEKIVGKENHTGGNENEIRDETELIHELIVSCKDRFFQKLLELLCDDNAHVKYCARKCLSPFLRSVDPEIYITALIEHITSDATAVIVDEILNTIEDIMRMSEFRCEPLQHQEEFDESNGDTSSGTMRCKGAKKSPLLPVIGVEDLKMASVRQLCASWSTITTTVTASHQDSVDCITTFFSLWESIVGWLNGNALRKQKEMRVFYDSIHSLLEVDRRLKSRLVSLHFFNVVHKALNFTDVITIKSDLQNFPSCSFLAELSSERFWSDRCWFDQNRCPFTGCTLEHMPADDYLMQSGGSLSDCLRRRLVTIVLETLTLQARLAPQICSSEHLMMLFKDFLTKHKVNTDDDSFARSLIDIFIDDDNALVECLLSCVEFHANLPVNSDVPTPLHRLHPDIMFYEFLRATGHDYEVLLDLLVNDETSFLLYIIKYLKLKTCVVDERQYESSSGNCLANVVHKHVGTSASGNQINIAGESSVSHSSYDDAPRNNGGHVTPEMRLSIRAILKKLSSSISKLDRANLFPYNPRPLLKLLAGFE